MMMRMLMSQAYCYSWIRGKRLEIEKLINLANSKLVARYSGTLESKGSAPPAVKIAPPTAVTDKWSDENWVAEEADF